LAVKFTVAFVCPTPPSTYALQSIERSALTVHEGEPEPDTRCELPGALAELKLPAFGPYVPGATAANATEAVKANRNIVNAVTIPSRLIFLASSSSQAAAASLDLLGRSWFGAPGAALPTPWRKGLSLSPVSHLPSP
jgi:hypothetical protein